MGSLNISPANACATENEELCRIFTYSTASYYAVSKTLDTQVKLIYPSSFSAQFFCLLKLIFVSFLFLFQFVNTVSKS